MIQIAYNAVNAKIVGASREAKLEVHRLLSYTVMGAEHMPSFRSGSWNGKSSFFSYERDLFPAGFVDLVSRGLRKAGFEVSLVRNPLPEPLGPERPEVDAFGYSPRYDYQPETIDRLVRHGQIIAQVATGGGKSRICRMAYKRIGRPTLFLTTRGVLMHQMKNAVEDMGEEVAVLGDGEWGIPYTKGDGSEGRRITKFCVGMVQTLSQRLETKTVEGELEALKQRRMGQLSKIVEEVKAECKKRKVPPHKVSDEITKAAQLFESRLPSPKHDRLLIEQKVERHNKLRDGTRKILERFELVIAEEAHELSGDGFFNVMAACRNANYRLALTATPFMKDDAEANMRLLASCGPVAIRITEKMLIERGILAKPYFKVLKLSEEAKPKALGKSTPWQRAYTVGIVNNEDRNRRLCAEVLRARRYGLNALMLVQHKAHGHVLVDMLRGAGARVEFIDGDSSQEERQTQLNALGAGRLDVLVGSTILDVGVDVPALGMVVLAGGGKAEVAMRQRIGRGLREKKNGMPNVAFIVDVYDEHNNHLRGHSAERQEIIKSTPGFAENIVADFDYRGLGLVPVA